MQKEKCALGYPAKTKHFQASCSRGAHIAAAALNRPVCPHAMSAKPLVPPATSDGTLPLAAYPANPPAATSHLTWKELGTWLHENSPNNSMTCYKSASLTPRHCRPDCGVSVHVTATVLNHRGTSKDPVLCTQAIIIKYNHVNATN